MELNAIRLLVDEFDRCFRFYRDVMGLMVELRTTEDVYAELNAGGVRLGIYQRELMNEVMHVEKRPRTRDDDTVALTFGVQDVDEAYVRLTQTGAQAANEPHDQIAWGLRVAHLRDPEGNLIEINAPLTP